MGKVQKGSGSKKALARSGRMRVRNEMERPGRIRASRKRHLKNALRSCGRPFAERLAEYYAKNPNPGNKHR